MCCENTILSERADDTDMQRVTLSRPSINNKASENQLNDLVITKDWMKIKEISVDGRDSFLILP